MNNSRDLGPGGSGGGERRCGYLNIIEVAIYLSMYRVC